MFSEIEQSLRWIILIGMFYSTWGIYKSYTEPLKVHLSFADRRWREARLVSNIMIFVHAGMNLWILYERTGRVF